MYGRKYDCCNEDKNLLRTFTDEKRWFDQCQVCNRKHYGIKVEPGEIKMFGNPLGTK